MEFILFIFAKQTIKKTLKTYNTNLSYLDIKNNIFYQKFTLQMYNMCIF